MIIGKMPALRKVILQDSDHLKESIVSHLTGLTEIHLEHGYGSLSRITSLLQRNAALFQKFSINWTWFSKSDKAIQRAFKDTHMPNLRNIDVEVQSRRDSWGDRIDMANFAWSRKKDNESKLNTWLGSSGWKKWDDQWTES